MSILLAIWLPTIVAAIAVFVASSIMHMVIRWHQRDEAKIPNEDAVADALRGLPPGEYRFPYAASMDEMKSAAFQEKAARGPMGRLGIYGGDMASGFRNALLMWFVYCLVATFIAGHVAYAALGRATDGHDVFHATALTAFAGFGLGVAQQSIWGPKKWWPTIKSLIDALIYAIVTGLVFVWLWPKG
jgi:hypothetical protein